MGFIDKHLKLLPSNTLIEVIFSSFTTPIFLLENHAKYIFQMLKKKPSKFWEGLNLIVQTENNKLINVSDL